MRYSKAEEERQTTYAVVIQQQSYASVLSEGKKRRLGVRTELEERTIFAAAENQSQGQPETSWVRYRDVFSLSLLCIRETFYSSILRYTNWKFGTLLDRNTDMQARCRSSDSIWILILLPIQICIHCISTDVTTEKETHSSNFQLRNFLAKGATSIKLSPGTFLVKLVTQPLASLNNDHSQISSNWWINEARKLFFWKEVVLVWIHFLLDNSLLLPSMPCQRGFFPNKKKDSEYESWVVVDVVPKPSSGEEWTCKEVLLCEESKQL